MFGLEEYKKEGVLDLRALLSISIGSVIGSGVVTVIGAAIGQTGKSAWLAYAGAVLLGFVLIAPFIMVSSMFRLRGGDYTIIASVLGTRMAGIYVMNFIFTNLATSLTATAMGIYARSLIPSLDAQAVSLVALTFFFGVNLLGVKAMSRLQKSMSVILIAALATFCIVGFGQLLPGTFSIAESGYFLNGHRGFLNAMVMLVISTTMHQTLAAFGGDAIHPKRDIPTAMIATSFIILVIYTSLGLVAANALPISMVADQPLTLVAKKILPMPLFVFFMIGGPIGAICTTLNSTFTAASKPLLQGAEDGWFPSFFQRTNRFGAPVGFMVCLYVVALVPILLKFDISTITNNAGFIYYMIKLVSLAAILKIPGKYPKQFGDSWLCISKRVFYSVMAAAFAAQCMMIYVSARNLSWIHIIVSLLMLAAACGAALYRMRTGKVKIDKEDLDDNSKGKYIDGIPS